MEAKKCHGDITQYYIAHLLDPALLENAKLINAYDENGKFKIQRNFMVTNEKSGRELGNPLNNYSSSGDQRDVNKRGVFSTRHDEDDDEDDDVSLDYRNVVKANKTLRRNQKDKCTSNDIVYKPPKCVLGDRFDERTTSYLCESCTLANSAIVKNTEFTSKGNHICKKICRYQTSLIRPFQSTKIKLEHSYCTKCGFKSPTCVCAYKVTCEVTVSIVFVQFTPNEKGHLNMVFFETGLPIHQ